MREREEEFMKNGTKMLFLFNPHAGKSQIRNKLMDIVSVFSAAGCRVQIYATQGHGDAIRAAAQYGRYMDCVVVSGGAGTLSATITGLRELEHVPSVGYIHTGTTNDFAYTHHLSKDMVQAAEDIVAGMPCPVDLGRLNDRYFTYVAGFGAFTDVSYKTPQEIKAVLGHQAYILEGVKMLSELTPYRMHVELEDEVLEGEFLVGLVTNSVRVAGIRGIAGKGVDLNDGYHEVLLVRTPRNTADLQKTLLELIQPGDQPEHVIRAKARRIRFRSEEPVDWVTDGEYGGTLTDAVIENLPGALSLVKDEKRILRSAGRKALESRLGNRREALEELEELEEREEMADRDLG